MKESLFNSYEYYEQIAPVEFVDTVVQKAHSLGLIDKEISIPDQAITLPSVEQFQAYERVYGIDTGNLVNPELNADKPLKRGINAGRLVFAAVEAIDQLPFEETPEGVGIFSKAVKTEYHFEESYDRNLPSTHNRHFPESHTWISEQVTLRHKDNLISVSVEKTEEKSSTLDGERRTSPATASQVLIDLDTQNVYYSSQSLGQGIYLPANERAAQFSTDEYLKHLACVVSEVSGNTQISSAYL